MKRCPECEFLYYDEQDRCDIDGTRLRFTTKLPTLPAQAAHGKSMRVRFMVLGLTTIILGIVLFILYPPQWRTSTSSPAAEVKPASVRDANTDSQLPPSQASPHRTSTPSPKSAAPSRDPFAPMETRTEKSDSSKPHVTSLGPANRSIEAKPAMNQVTTANQASPASQQPTTPSYSNSAPSVRPVSAATATPKPVTQNSNKDSKFNSLMKKAGRILKKPF
jgi:hypothetical protein